MFLKWRLICTVLQSPNKQTHFCCYICFVAYFGYILRGFIKQTKISRWVKIRDYIEQKLEMFILWILLFRFHLYLSETNFKINDPNQCAMSQVKENDHSGIIAKQTKLFYGILCRLTCFLYSLPIKLMRNAMNPARTFVSFQRPKQVSFKCVF